MALRVLLGDESSTIKKVFQLALQDFAVDVRPVNIGVDVVSVAQAFKPDIIFADVLLQKKNGYEVALEVKQHPSLKNIPVVLMWSGFMELDEDKFHTCLANAQLEKPFDVAALRKLVTDLVPKTQSQRLSQFLTFPQMPAMEEPKAKGSTPPALPLVEETAEEDFQQVPIPKMKSAQNDKFRVNLKPEELEPDHIPVDYDMPSESLNATEIEAEEDEEFSFREATKVGKPTAPPKLRPSPPPLAADADLELDEDLIDESMPSIEMTNVAPLPAASSLTDAQLEKIIRAQSAEVIEAVVWKIVPDLAKQIIERELNRLLKERDSHP